MYNPNTSPEVRDLLIAAEQVAIPTAETQPVFSREQIPAERTASSSIAQAAMNPTDRATLSLTPEVSSEQLVRDIEAWSAQISSYRKTVPITPGTKEGHTLAA